MSMGLAAENRSARKLGREPVRLEPAIIAGRVPPHDLDAEAAVIAAVLLSRDALDRVMELLKSEHFYSDANGRIYDASVQLASVGTPVDVVTVVSYLRDREKLAGVGGMAYVAQLADKTPAVANVAAHAQTIVEKSRQRRLIATCQVIAASGYGDVGDPSEWIAGAEQAIAEISREGANPDRVYGAASIFDPPPVPAALVPQLDIGPGSPALIAGFGFSRKTLAVQDLALAVAGERRAWGDVRVGAGQVLHLDYEQGASLTLMRYRRLARAKGLELRHLDGRVRLMSPAPYLLDSQGAEERLARACAGHALLIVDSLRAAAPTLDENSSDVRRVLDMLMRVSDRTGCTALVVHHARKPSREDKGGSKMSIRGSGAIFDACASVIGFSAEKGEPTLVQHEKARASGVLHEDFYLESEDVEIDGDPRGGLRIVTKTIQQVHPPLAPTDRLAALKRDIVAAVRGENITSLNGICARVSGGNKGVKLAAIDELKVEGRLTQIGGTFRVQD